MKKNLLLLAVLLMAIITAKAQVTQINSNKSLYATIPLNNVQTIVTSQTDSTLWVTEGNSESTQQLSTSVKFVGIGGLLNGNFIFHGWMPGTGSELYITNGTAGGTTLLKDITLGTAGSDPADFVLHNGFIYFTAVTAAEGRELWRTNGTAAGTTLVKDINTGTAGSNEENNYNLVSTGTYLLFAASGSATQGVELWRSDGTDAGTTMLKDIYTGSDSSKPHNFIVYNNMVLFLAKNAANGEELWKTDGSGANTTIVKDINVGPASCSTIELFPGFGFPVAFNSHSFNNKVYFTATDGSSGGQVWATDGTTGNTTLLKDIIPGIGIASVLLFDAVDAAGKFIFPVGDGTSSSLWQSDGTTAGTTLFKSFSFVSAGQLPFIALNYTFQNGNLSQALFQGNKFFFVGGSDAEGKELWVSDGTIANTTIVKDVNPGTADGIDFAGNIFFLYTSTAFFFAATVGTAGNELWRTDGTAANTEMVEDINNVSLDANPMLGIVNNNKVIFSATDGDDDNNTDLFVVDGNFAPLPVRLTGFSVVKENKDAVLHWYTQEEVNSKNFTVQRSYDAVHFENIGIVQAAGNSSNKLSYQFTDVNIAGSGKPIIYYRLLTIDNDGKMQLSNIVSLKSNVKTWNVQLAANPVLDNIKLNVTGTEGNIQIAITDMTGKLVYSSTLPIVNSTLTIPAAVLPRGFYAMAVINGTDKRIVRFIK
ncbi:MAG: T9SS type A sorting domain-containing protein [Bacteroidota bacterium]